MPNVTIIGGGPAGGTAAILLARAGWDVTLLEQSQFPRDKVCGECLSALGFDVLTRLELSKRFKEAGAVSLCRATFHAASGRSCSADLPSPMWGLSRGALDALLLDIARESGATVRFRVRCEGVDSESPTAIAVRLRDLSRNTVETIQTGYVLLANGNSSFANDAAAPTGDFGIKAHFRNVDGPRDAIELFGIQGSYGGLAAVEGDRWNAAFSVPAARLKEQGGNVQSLWDHIVGENSGLARRVENAQRVGEWLAAPLPRFAVRRRWPARMIPLGNAAAAIEPIGGEGMGLAMRSAELACEALLSAEASAAPNRVRRRLGETYRSLWRRRRIVCRAAGIAASTPSVGSALVTLPAAGAALAATMRCIGKHTSRVANHASSHASAAGKPAR